METLNFLEQATGDRTQWPDGWRPRGASSARKERERERERERESVDGEKSSVLVSSSWRLDSVGWGERNSWDSVWVESTVVTVWGSSTGGTVWSKGAQQLDNVVGERNSWDSVGEPKN